MNDQVAELSREELLRRYAKKSPAAPTDATRRSPFKFLDSYEAGDADIFFGRDSEIEELLRHFHSFGHVLIYGESGSGKTSLVQCGLRSRIPAADALLIPLRVHANGLSSVCRQICESVALALGEPVEVSPQSGLIETLREVRQVASRPVVLFFDQFEELFIFHDAETRRRFADELASLRQARLNVKVIIGVRQDYLAHLSELEDTVAGLFDNRFWLRRMSRENAAGAVVQACQTCDVGIDDELARSVLQRLDPSGLGIELPYLQVVMDRLYRQAVSTDAAHPVITAQDVQQLGDIDNILGSFLVEEVAKLPSPDAGRQILKAFVTREGTRRTLDRESVEQEASGFGAAIEPADLDAHLSQLTRVRILREIAETESYELRHDALAATVAGWISEVEKELIEVRDNLVNRFKEYEARGGQQAALLDQGFLDYLSVYQQRLQPLLNDKLRKYVEDSQRHVGQAIRFRRRARQLITGVVGSIILAFLVLALWQWNAATQREQEAKANFATAEAERQRADDARKDAQRQRDNAERQLYFNHIQSAQREWETNSAAAAWPHLNACRADQRGWEYRYLHCLFTRNHETLRGHTGVVFSVAFSPDGSRIVSGSLDNTVKLWDAHTGEQTLTLEGHTDEVWSVAFSPDGSRIVSGSWDTTLKLWDAGTGEQTLTLNGHTAPVYSVAFSPDGSRVVSGSGDNTLKLWDARTGEQTLTLQGHTGYVRSAAFSPDGSRIVSGSRDNTVKLWDARTGEQTLTLEGHTDEVWSVAFSPDGSRIVSGSRDNTLKLWDAGTGEQMLTLERHTDEVRSVAFSPDGSRIVSGSWDNTLKLWDAHTGEQTLTLKGHTNLVFSVAFSPDGSRIVSGSGEKTEDNTLKLWDARTGDQTLTLKGHTDKVWSVAFSPDGSRIVSGSGDNTLKLWDARTGDQTLTLNGHTMAFSPDGSRIVSDSMGNTLKLWDARTGEEMMTLQGHTGYVRSVAFSPDGSRIVSGSGDNTLKLWDANSGEETLTLEGHTDEVWSVAFSPDGSRIVSGSGDNTLKLWDARTGEQTLTLKGHTDDVHSVAFSPDGSRIVSGSRDNTLKLWDARTGQQTLTLEGHTDPVSSVAFSPDGSRIVSGSGDNTLKLWDARTGAETLTLKKHAGTVYSVAFSPDGSRIVSGSSDSTLKLWDASGDGPFSRWQQAADSAKLDEMANHEHGAALGEKTNDWYAAAFHLGWLSALNPDETSLQERRAAAESKLREKGLAIPPVPAPTEFQVVLFRGQKYARLLESLPTGDAEQLLREALASHEQQDPASPLTFHLRSLLGAALTGQRKFTEAEPLLIEGYIGLGLAQFNRAWLSGARQRLFANDAAGGNSAESLAKARGLVEQQLEHHPDNEGLAAELVEVLRIEGMSDADAASRLAKLTEEGQVASMLGARADRIVPSGSQWKWLHRVDGIDPATEDSDFHSTFFTATYDDSHWQTGRDSSGPTGGFGYGDPVGVQFDTPATEHRKTAWFRHKFTTDHAHDKLAISLQRDDGVIVYLDGAEVGRNNVEDDAPEAFDLLATRALSAPEETEVQFFQLAGTLDPGEHILTISLHNGAAQSSDLRIAEITLWGTPVDSN